jgi:xylulokinase
MALVAGIDCSTQATKALVVDADTGAVVAEGRAPHVVVGEGGARETDPEVWWTALAVALRDTGRAGDVAALAVGGQQHGLVLGDADARPLRAAMLWNDVRSAPQAAALTDALGGPGWWADRMGSVPVAAYTATKWAWLRDHEPDVLRAAVHVGLPHDWLTQRLCGRHATDRGDASGTAWWSTAAESYDEQVLAHLDLDPAALPVVLGPLEAAGQVVPAAAEALGLPAGALVGPGTGDNMAAALGLGVQPGQPVMSLGTSGTAYAVSRRRPADPTGTVSGFADAAGAWLPLACTLNCTQAVDRVAAWLGLDREQVAPRTDVTVLPFLDGERTPDLPHASGAVLGLRHSTTREEILRAAYEGAVASLVAAVDAIAAQSGGLDPDAPLVLIGGGARGAAWREVVGRATGRPLQIPDQQELVALGAAVQAAAVLDGVPAADVAARWDTRRGTVVPAVEADAELADRVAAVAARTFG